MNRTEKMHRKRRRRSLAKRPGIAVTVSRIPREPEPEPAREPAARIFTSYEVLMNFLLANPAAYHITAVHQDQCSPSWCSCHPEWEVRPLTVEAYEEGQRRQDAWARATSS